MLKEERINKAKWLLLTSLVGVYVRMHVYVKEVDIAETRGRSFSYVVGQLS